MIAYLLSLGVTSVPKAEAPAEGARTEVVIVGGAHERHHRNRLYTPEIPRDVVLALKPEVISSTNYL